MVASEIYLSVVSGNRHWKTDLVRERETEREREMGEIQADMDTQVM